MRKFILTSSICFFVMILFGQNFPGKRMDLLLGQELKVLPKEESLQGYGYDGFFRDLKLKKKYACCQSYNSKYKALVNKVFIVTSIQEVLDRYGDIKYALQLDNKETGIVFFHYQPEYEHTFPFEVVGGLKLPENFFCDQVEVETDKFTNETKSRSPFKAGIGFIKVDTDDDCHIYMSVSTVGSTANVGKTGLYIILDNGEKIIRKDAKIDAKVNKGRYSSGYVYSAFIRLTENEINLFSQHRITDTRLYVYDSVIDPEDGKYIMEFLKCMIK